MVSEDAVSSSSRGLTLLEKMRDAISKSTMTVRGAFDVLDRGGEIVSFPSFFFFFFPLFRSSLLAIDTMFSLSHVLFLPLLLLLQVLASSMWMV